MSVVVVVPHPLHLHCLNLLEGVADLADLRFGLDLLCMMSSCLGFL